MVQPSNFQENNNFAEKSFYLETFRGHVLILSLVPQEPAGFDHEALQSLASTAEELSANGVNTFVLCTEEVARQMANEDMAGTHDIGKNVISLSTASLNASTVVGAIWSQLRVGRMCIGTLDSRDAESFARSSAVIAGRIQSYKLIFVESHGGISTTSGEHLSFMDASMLDAALGSGEAEFTGIAARKGILEAIRLALKSRVDSVNICSLPGLARELFTYNGSGTLFTAADYCIVSDLGFDDFAEVERLIERGTEEGYLRERSPEAITMILANGFGAKIAGHLAGVCGLITEPYEKDRAGEIVALYTVTRFKGERVGSKLLSHAIRSAQEQGLAYVFAVTASQQALAFFTRQGFAKVSDTELPEEKWREDSDHRRKAVTCLILRLECR